MPSELEPLHDSATYKIRLSALEVSLFVTIVDDEDQRPIHMFINSKHMPSYEWLTGTLELLNAALGADEFPLDLVQRAAQVHDAQGGYWAAGQHIPSVPAHIARTLLKHAENRGFAPVEQVSG